MNSRDKEKERLWNEVMNQKRPWQADSLDVDALSRELEKDYGVKEEKPFDSKAVFTQAEEALSQKVIGQKEAVHAFTLALRRPYVSGHEKGKAENTILVLGPEGSGKHTLIKEAFQELYRRQIVLSADVRTIDLSRYASASQEQIFLQDLYEAFSGKEAAVCFENFRSCFPGFLRMLADLVIQGEMILNRRYVLRQGILVENQTGLVKEAVDHLSANDRYLIFIHEGKKAEVQDAYGADFLNHVPDVVELKPLAVDDMKKIIRQEEEKLTAFSEKQLKVKLVFDASLTDWVLAHYEKERGTRSVRELFAAFQASLNGVVLQEGLTENTELQAVCVNGIPCLRKDEKTWKLSRETDRQEEMAAVNAELDQIVGLGEVKEYMHSLQANVLIQQRRKEQGLKSSPVSMHMIFTGNPGTGKTTIARLLARYLKAAGVLSRGQLVEVSRSSLVARYVGQTAPLTMSVINSALGGVLFIDEAYSLYRGKEDAFGLECIDTLVKAMEDHREDLVVILAGYEKEMKVFLEANSGLKSRFPNVIDFPDYTGGELRQIAVIQAQARGYEIEEKAQNRLEAYFAMVQNTRAAEAGNGRLARNTVEAAILKQAERLVQDPDGDLNLLKDEDFILK